MVGTPARHDVLVACAPAGAATRHAHLLSTEESRRAGAFAPRRAQEFTAGRALLRWALERGLGSWTRTCRIGRTDQGKPLLEGHPATGVSISHSSGAVAVAVAVGRAVGVDIQGPVPPTTGLLERCCSRSQRHELALLPPDRRATALARRWAIHEACAKTTGTGPISRPETYPGVLLADGGRWRNLRWRVLQPLPGAAVAVAFDQPHHPAVLRLAVLAPETGRFLPPHAPAPEGRPASR
ncbi:4'-phosphopantetheinyl transferase family protein [Streptomyces sp. NPDC057245]|uniref:4'-phosphopantetheinyl transferase family protein n=1 Tax=Streptomyces TaxID=1883 RepID=UPI001C1E3D4D|nr:4'-phosphopantetheinyl transferase superfamily protein [Streptomyces sp. A108]MBU6533254.1 4'-phosphopantetheinyl transferase superfamily protein [Streptomyces sp. A108]